MNSKTLSDDQLLTQTSSAVYLIQAVPEVIEKIESGTMPVTVAANIQSFLYAEKRLDHEDSLVAKLELVETCTGKSVRAITEDRVRVSHSISNQLEEKLQRIKLLWSHVDPNMSREQLLDRMAALTLEQIDSLRKAQRAEKRESAKPMSDDLDRASTLNSNEFEEKACTTNMKPIQDPKIAKTLKTRITFRAPEVQQLRRLNESETRATFARHNPLCSEASIDPS